MFERKELVMKEQLEQLRAKAFAALEEASDLKALDSLRVQFLGKKVRFPQS